MIANGEFKYRFSEYDYSNTQAIYPFIGKTYAKFKVDMMEKAQSERNSHSKQRGGKKLN